VSTKEEAVGDEVDDIGDPEMLARTRAAVRLK